MDENSELLAKRQTPVYPRQTGVTYENLEKEKKLEKNKNDTKNVKQK